MDRLDKSLDELIVRRGKGEMRQGKGKQTNRPSVGGKIRSNLNNRLNRQSLPYREITSEPITIVRKPLVKSRPPESLVITKRVEAAAIKPHVTYEPLPPMQKGSILSRLGGNAGVSGTAVIFSNLNPDIRASDIAELCGTIGETKRVEMQYDAHGTYIIIQ